MAGDYSQWLDVTTNMGDLADGIEMALSAQRDGYDIIISRGGTAEVIESALSIPVVNIEVSGYDFLRVIRLPENISGRITFIGYSFITERARSINELLDTGIDLFSIQNQNEIEPLLRRLNAEGYREVLGAAEDMKEDKASWFAFLQWLRARGLEGVQVVVGDKCLGMLEAVGEIYPEAQYQRCTVHFYRSVFSAVPRFKMKLVAKI